MKRRACGAFIFAFALITGTAVTPLHAAEPETATVSNPVKRPPPFLQYQASQNGISYKLLLQPGLVHAGEVASLSLQLAQTLTVADPAYGNERPLEDVKVQAIFVGPSDKKNKTPWVAARQGMHLEDPGSYGFTFTMPADGVYTLYIRGTANGATALDYQVMIPIGQTTIPENATAAVLPKTLPPALEYDAAHGAVLCKARCRTDIEGVISSGGAPVFISSAMAIQLNDDALLQTMVGESAVATLPLTAQYDLLKHLRTLHTPITAFFPSAAAVLPKSFTINEYGRERLRDALGSKVDAAAATGTVFVVYKNATTPKSPALVAFDDRVTRDTLKRGDKMGYVMFFDMTGTEVGMAVGTEPNYPILAMVAHGTKGSDEDLNRQLQVYVGQGRFNDPKSIKGGPDSLRAKILPLYLRAAELATMYVSEEREFTAFDQEFN